MTQAANHNTARNISRNDFVSLLVRHDRRLRSFISTLLARVDDIEEIVQSTCLVAWSKVDSFSYCGTTADEEFVRWICTIARYEVLTLRRSKASSHLLFFDDSLMDRLAALQFDESLHFEQQHQALIHCLQRLRPRDREMTRLFYQPETTVHDVAARFGVGVNAVYKSLTRIRSALLECIQRSLKQEGCL